MSEIYSDVRDNDLFSYIPTDDGPAKRVVISTGDATLGPANRLPVEINKAYVDAFQRLRVAQPVSILDSKNVNVIDEQFGETLTGSGTSSFDYAQSAVLMNLTTASGDKVLRRTHQYNSYTPGRSLEFFITGKFSTGKTNLVQKIGLYDDENGFFFQVSGTQLSVGKRSSVSGSVVNTVVNQSSWNVDVMDGNGRSGKTLVYDKTNIFVITYQWLGVGTVTLAVDIDGELQPVHQFYHASIEDSVYIRNPSLPITFEIENTGITSDASQMKQICCNVNSSSLQGQFTSTFEASNNVTLISVPTTSGGAFLLSIAPKLIYPATKVNRFTLDVANFSIYAQTNTLYYEIRLYTFPSAVTGVWTSVDASSSVEFSVNPGFTGTYKILDAGYIAAASGGKVNVRNVAQIGPGRNDKIQIYLNYAGDNRYIFAIWARAIGGTASAAASIKWTEFN